MSVILVATADAEFMNILEAEVEAEGHSLIWASDGKEAQDLTLQEAPDLVFLDLNLAIFNGLECAASLREDPDVPAELPIILVTDDELDPHQLDNAGVSLHFPKTHAALDLRDMLVDHLQGYRKR